MQYLSCGRGPFYPGTTSDLDTYRFNSRHEALHNVFRRATSLGQARGEQVASDGPTGYRVGKYRFWLEECGEE